MMPTPNGFDAVLATFGDPRTNNEAWQAANLVSVHCPFPMRYFDDDGSVSIVTHIKLHKLVAEAFTLVQSDVLTYIRLAIKKEQGFDKSTNFYSNAVLDRIREDGYDIFGGSYVYRNIRGSSTHLSMHSFGIAIDISPERNPRQATLKTDFPDWYIKTWEKYGWFWGGNFHGLKDPQHWQMATGC